MARTSNITVQNNFVKGLITEATGLTFPENACPETYNCEFDRTGKVSRRSGIDFEDNSTDSTQTLTGKVIKDFLWKNVAGRGDLTFYVVQIGNILHFYESTGDSGLSTNKHATTIDLTAHLPGGVTTVATLECQFTSGNGLLFVTNSGATTFYVEYDPVGDTLTATDITIQIRDFEGDTTDANAIDSRPTSTLAGLSAAHRYNLQNQGWTTTTLTSWDTARTDMPSNCDVAWYFKNSSDNFDFSSASHNVGDQVIGNSPAPKGHYIYSIYNFDRSTNFSGANSYTIDTARVSTCAFFAGRVFYSGLQYGKFTSTIYFSQIVESKTQYGKCYQVNDPTSETLFDLLPSDGGTIDLGEAGPVIFMFPAFSSLLCFCTNGIWAISGGTDTGFTANAYTISKISSVPAISASSFVDVDGVPYWWNIDGIYTLGVDPQSKTFKVTSLTDNTIRTFYQAIPLESKRNAKGSYSSLEGKVQWVYKSESEDSFESKYVFNRLLNLNTITGAFYPWTFDSTAVHIHGLQSITGVGGAFAEYTVINVADNVIDGADTVTAFLATTGGTSSITKFFVSHTNGTKVTFAEPQDDVLTTYVDWFSEDSVGEEFDSYFVSGYLVRGEAMRKFQENYIRVLSTNDIASSYLVRGRWGYSASVDSGRWSTTQTMTHTAGEYIYKPKKIKIRGHGLACQFEIRNNGNDPFNIIGWSTFETGNRWI